MRRRHVSASRRINSDALIGKVVSCERAVSRRTPATSCRSPRRAANVILDEVAADLATALHGIPVEAIEHVGSTSVPGLAAKPVLDIDILASDDLPAAIARLTEAGYTHQGDLGVTGREAFRAPDDEPRRNVYLSIRDNLHIKNHLAVRDILRARPDLRDEYAAVKQSLAADPDIDIDTYVARKSAVLQRILAESS